jgi:metal-dependent amidase/aminoacylase/carboxypeptidase family protein
MSGALDVIAAGGLEGIDSIFGLHCDPRLEVEKVGTRVGRSPPPRTGWSCD